MIERKEYLDRLVAWHDKRVIKIVTGIRRCGKSVLLKLFRNHLLESGVPEAQIVAVDLDDLRFAHLLDKVQLHDYVLSHHVPGKKLYVLLDEVQNAPEFEKCIDSLYLHDDLDIYITGSNAFFLSGDLATLLSGRYVTIEMLPLSFFEYVSFTGNREDLAKKYRDYTSYGAFPYITALGGDGQNIDDYLRGIYSTIVLKDIMKHYKFNDTMQLESVLSFCFSNIGSKLSTKSIADTMTSDGRKIDVKTVEKYLSAFTGSFILYQAKRYDVKGKQLLKTLEKYYVSDVGLRYMLLGRKNTDVGHILENIVYLELIRRGYTVHIGKVGEQEIDFVAASPKQGTAYFQVAATVRDAKTLARELAPLKTVGDSYPKFLLTLDEDPDGDYDGIQKRNALDWLLNK
jgi:predicted AAA+ superfamily ATPase